jgi:signal transduction histidine kinase
MPDEDRYVDSDGHATEPFDDERAATVLSRGGQPVAVIRHDRALHIDRETIDQIGSAARLAIDNERLRAALLATLEDIRASRRRIVAAADETRRGLERNLHDGPQQRLLAAGFALRLAAASTALTADPDRSARITNALDEVQTALAELREIAHGIFPAILDEAGLSTALESLAESSATPVRVVSAMEGPLPPSVAAAAYFLVRATIDAADGAALQVAVHAHDGTLVVRVDGARADDYVHVADRVGALGGELRVREGCVEAELPCV